VDLIASHVTAFERVMKVAGRGALLEVVDHDGRGRHQPGMDLLLLRMIRPDRGDERARAHMIRGQQGLVRRRAGHDHVARAGGFREVGDRLELDAKIESQLVGKPIRSAGVPDPTREPDRAPAPDAVHGAGRGPALRSRSRSPCAKKGEPDTGQRPRWPPRCAAR
jgi:hypothetical protein